jgi:hypothetical protein
MPTLPSTLARSIALRSEQPPLGSCDPRGCPFETSPRPRVPCTFPGENVEVTRVSLGRDCETDICNTRLTRGHAPSSRSSSPARDRRPDPRSSVTRVPPCDGSLRHVESHAFYFVGLKRSRDRFPPTRVPVGGGACSLEGINHLEHSAIWQSVKAVTERML